MGEESISYTISVEDMTKPGTDSATRNLEKLGGNVEKTSQVAKLGFWGMGEAAENAAQSMGVPNQVSRQLGNSIENLAGKLGAGALAFGGLAFVVMAGVGIWQHYADAQKKAAEETLKAADASGKWIESALGEAAQTRELTAAKNALKAAEFESNKVRIESGIVAQQAVIEGLQKQYDKVVQIRGQLESDTTGSFWQQSLVGSMLHGGKSDREIAVRDIKLKLDEASAKLKEFYAQQQLYSEENKSKISGGGRFPWAEYKAALDFEAQYQQVLAMSIGQAEAEEFRRENQAKKELEFVNTQKRLEKDLAQYKYDTIMNSLQAIDSATKGKYKAIFLAMRGMAASQAIIQGNAAAVAALAPPPIGLGPVAGQPLAFWAKLQGYTAAAAIMAQAFTGSGGRGGGASGGSVGTYGAGQTGLPEYKYFSYEQSKYGTGWRPGEGGQGGATYVIQGDVYAQDDESFRKKVSTAVVRSAKNREYGVREAMA